jgi:acetate kinase
MAQAILTLNAGSSSIKFALFAPGAGEPAAMVAGKIEGIGTSPHFVARDTAGKALAERRWRDGARLGHEDFLGILLGWVEEHLGGTELVGVGHRVVHGGDRLVAPTRVTPALMEALEALVPLAPLHQPHNLAAIKAVAATRPKLAQIACFDTAFHHDQPAVARRFAIPRALEAEGVLRYGFHGLSYEYIARCVARLDPTLARGRVIVAHLGNGASLCAMKAGRGIDTTMSFTALDGLVMSTRCGAIDPGVLLYLLRQKGMTPDALSDLLYDRSGLLGVSGVSSDMRALLDSDDPHAAEAVDLFTYRIAREAGALAASLGGLDGVVFTAGIGENAPQVRRDVCQRMAWLGIALDEEANAANAPVISRSDSRVTVRVIPTDEERMIALHTLGVLKDAHSSSASS